MRRAARVLLLAWLVAAPAHAEEEGAPAVLPPQARLGGQAVSIPRVRLGEPFQIAIAVRAPVDVVVDLPASLETDPFEILDRREAPPLREDDVIVRREWELDVVAWQTGELGFPSIPVKYFVAGEERLVATEPLTVLVEATIPEGSEPKPAEAAPPVSVTQFDPRFLIAIGAALGVALLAFSAWLVWSTVRRRGRVEARVIPIDTRTAEEIALDKLRALGAGELIEKEDRRLYYFALTEIVREYLGRRFGFDALEQTTSELIDALRARSIDRALEDDVASWTASCDLIKYARVKATRDEAQGALDAAIAIVEKARPVPVASPEAIARAG